MLFLPQGRSTPAATARAVKWTPAYFGDRGLRVVSPSAVRHLIACNIEKARRTGSVGLTERRYGAKCCGGCSELMLECAVPAITAIRARRCGNPRDGHGRCCGQPPHHPTSLEFCQPAR